MLQRTFLHLPRIGEKTERILWDQGVRTWEHLLDGVTKGSLPGRRFAGAEDPVRESMRRYAEGDWSFFDGCIPSAHKWRAFQDLGDRALYVDIETTGGVGGESITVIGTYDGHRARAFIAGRDLDQAQELLESHPLVITFNGAQFDLPILRDRFRYNHFNFVHIDLRHPLARLGFNGGLKAIEERLGIERSPETRGMGGFDAVLLWRQYEATDDERALDLLVRYNLEDVCHLAPLMQLVVREMSAGLVLSDPV
jgi:uncharacterized protein